MGSTSLGCFTLLLVCPSSAMLAARMVTGHLASGRVRALASMATLPAKERLNILLFEGSVRYGRIGPRVSKFCASTLRARGHEVSVFDTRTFDTSTSEFRPHFFYQAGKAPRVLAELADAITRADAFVMLSPEYNHAASPALMNVLNHFGSSLFAFKPSAIVCYSAGQWGGTRAAMSLRPFLSELGCPPVSALVLVPSAQTVFDAEGLVVGGDDARERWAAYAARCWAQLEWWGTACRRQRAVCDPFDESPPFTNQPSQRNAP
mmetsp:Transcript_12664/g.33041  ORF Transcript_12664/g.33041 Transcript_12664/m.33041 type:complete len:263 (+) Transcript_12664:46-834(+)